MHCGLYEVANTYSKQLYIIVLSPKWITTEIPLVCSGVNSILVPRGRVRFGSRFLVVTRKSAASGQENV